jgi:DNA-binding transcriptional ArsR family regulator
VGSARAAVLEALYEPQATGAVAASVGLAASTVSEHLRALTLIGLIDRMREGRQVYYILNGRGRCLLSLFSPEDTGSEGRP